MKPDHGHVERSFTDIWFGDPGAYPVIVIISGACVFCFCVGMRALFFYPDCRCVCASRGGAPAPLPGACFHGSPPRSLHVSRSITKGKRTQLIRDWT